MILKFIPITYVFMLACFSAHSQLTGTSDIKIKKKEFEIAMMVGASERGGLIMTQAIFRAPIPYKFKIGAGLSISADGEKGGAHPGVFADVLKLVGNNQKWSFNLQWGRAFYSRTFSFSGFNQTHYKTKEYNERIFQLAAIYRINLSKKICLPIGGYFLSQSFKTFTEGTDGLGQPLNPFYSRDNYTGGGLKVGLIF